MKTEAIMGESGEMYLETILVLSKKQNRVRAVNVAEEMELSKASVSIALGKLKASGCVTVDEGGQLSLTEKGRGIAEKIYERHQVLSRILMCLGVDEKTAVDDACRMEHVISDTSFAAVKRYLAEHPQGAASVS
ncbi:MAG: metal-dependent transcriptional regulator [Clostridia bacterium]|nr:metal-dependent transcriptional regulator [Clostridia bacterium]